MRIYGFQIFHASEPTLQGAFAKKTSKRIIIVTCPAKTNLVHTSKFTATVIRKIF